MDVIKVCIFDAYGTLFDVNAACRELSKEVGEQWKDLATLWRLRQVEYTWLRNSMNEYINFWNITEDALEYAMETLNIKNEELKNKVVRFISKIRSIPRGRKSFNAIKKRRLQTGILSNGSEEMLASAVKNAKIRRIY